MDAWGAAENGNGWQEQTSTEDAWGGGGGATTGGDGDYTNEEQPQRSNGCFQCGEEGHRKSECPNKPKMTCRNCNEEGHMSRECPNKPAMTCRKCNEEGHMARECPNAPPMKCRRCNEEGHSIAECTQEDDRPCFNCGETGHLSRDCAEPRKERKPMVCHRCNQEGHKISECTEPPVERLGEDGQPLPAPVTYVPPELSTEAAMSDYSYGNANIDRFATLEVSVSDAAFTQGLESFEQAQLNEFLLNKVRDMGYVRPSPIQQYAIPVVSAGKDLVACSQTGSGKTAAFILPIVNQIMADQELESLSAIAGRTQHPLVLVLAPTRELCIQIYNQFMIFTSEVPRRIGVSKAYGGTEVRTSMNSIRAGTHVLCAVPGRLKQCLKDGVISLSKLRYMILDEGDRMLDSGFGTDIQEFLAHESMPSKDQRQTLMFSATFPESVQELTYQILRPNETVKVAIGATGRVNADVEQTFIEAASFIEKRQALLEILEQYPLTKKDSSAEELWSQRQLIMIFIEQKKQADILGLFLNMQGYDTTTMHGSRDQAQREQSLGTFRCGQYPILVATSVAARGLDIKGVTLVVNFDLPKCLDDYVHRVGRTGRVGLPGKAISLFSPTQDAALAPALVTALTECNQPVPEFISAAASGASMDFGGFDNEAGGDTGGWNSGEATETVEGW